MRGFARSLLVVVLCVLGTSLVPGIAARAASSSKAGLVAFDCHRVLRPAEWRSVLGHAVSVKTGESVQDCLWRAGTQSWLGGISGYPAVYKIWHRIYTDDATGVDRRPGECREVDSTRARPSGFRGDFAWTVEVQEYAIPGPEGYSCPGAKELRETDRDVYVVHHGRLLLIRTGEPAGQQSATMAQLVRLARSAVKRF